MDNISHSLTAVAMSRAGLNRIDPLATPVLLISGNIPDIDILAFAGGPLKYLEVHRGYTHSLVGLPVMAILSVVIVRAFVRRRVSVLRLFSLACLGVVSHLLLDWTNSYGIRLLLPWSSRWCHLDLNSLTDYLFVTALFLAWTWPYFENLVRGEIGSRKSPGRIVPTLALLFFGALECTRTITHAHVTTQMNTVMYQDQSAWNISALPDPVNPFAWRAVVETANAYLTVRVNALRPFDPFDQETFAKLPRDATIDAVRGTEPFKYFQYFSRFPVWSEQPGSISGPKTVRLDLTDLRFGRPGEGDFHCIGLVNSADQVLLSIFTFGSGANFGWSNGVNARMGTE